MPYVLLGELLTLQSDRSPGDLDRIVPGDRLPTGDLFTIFMSFLGIICALLPCPFPPSGDLCASLGSEMLDPKLGSSSSCL